MTQHDRPTAIFLHYGKTGGSTIGSVVDRQYPLNQLYVAHFNRDNDTFAALPPEKRAVLCYRGITYYGIHRHIPRPSVYFAILRNPIDRVISQHYENLRRRKRNGEVLRREPSLAEMLDREKFGIQLHMQLSMTVGAPDMQTALSQPLPADALSIAQHNVEKHFVVLGVLDYYDESLLMFAQALGWRRHLYYGFRNRGTDKPAREHIAPEVLARIEAGCAQEMAFYQWAKARFEQQLAQQPPSFHQELERFRRYNAWYGRLWRFSRRIRQTKMWHRIRQRIAPTWQRDD